jgi:uncharacterized protein with PQ loop repeat
VKREELARIIHWPFIIWLAGIINVGAMLPQLYKIWSTHSSKDVSEEMIWIYLVIQIAFSLQGYFRRDRMLMICLGLSAVVSAVTIMSIRLVR